MGTPLQRVCVCFLAGAALFVAAAGASATTRTFRGKPRAHGAYVFRIAGISSARIDGARLEGPGGGQPVSAARVERAAPTGQLRVRPRGVLARCARVRCKLRLLVRLHYPVRPSVSGEASACAFGSFAVGNWPGPCWRPYADTSPFNRPLPADPRLAANSARIVDRVAGWGRPKDKLEVPGSPTAEDYGHPWYLAGQSDPRFTVHCTESWGHCALEGATVRIPDAARGANGPDAHLAVVNQASGWEYDFYGVRSKPRGGGRLTTRWAGRTRIGSADASGLGGQATGSGFGLLAGAIRGPEAAAFDIPHALFMTVRCTDGKPVYPAHGQGQLCSQLGASDEDAPGFGTRFQLDMTDAQIAALGAPPLQTAILRAMAHYGMFVGDTGGEPWQIAFESDATYTSFGRTPQVGSAFRASGARH